MHRPTTSALLGILAGMLTLIGCGADGPAPAEPVNESAGAAAAAGEAGEAGEAAAVGEAAAEAEGEAGEEAGETEGEAAEGAGGEAEGQ